MKPNMIARRIVILIVGIGAMTGFGVRSHTGRAASWERAVFKGPARTSLKVWLTLPEDEAPAQAVDVYAGGTYATALSEFKDGVLLRTGFALPPDSDQAVLKLDLDRLKSRVAWDGDDRDHMKARFYLVSKDGKATVFDGEPVSGQIALEKVVFGNGVVGFRVRGTLEFADPGVDEALDTADDLIAEIDVLFETSPAPEEIAADATQQSPLPAVPVCDWPYCYEDDTYYYDPYYNGSCGASDGDYGTYDDGSGGGCEGDTVDDPPDYSWDDGGDWSDTSDITDSGSSDGCGDGSDDYDSSGCGDSSSDSSSDGCDGSSSGSSSEGCGDSGSSASGCGGSSGGSGCGGCSGDTLERAPEDGDGGGTPERVLEGGLGWLLIMGLAGAVVALHRRED
ncbi:MAG: hypothetical protein KC635_05880 [Myxococcales bacterium]|nr:hypothetical protein [Myxococcales bacterium]MCB9735687.1 hypothetical protein [Deltaproteobacteria bacterium]